MTVQLTCELKFSLVDDMPPAPLDVQDMPDTEVHIDDIGHLHLRQGQHEVLIPVEVVPAFMDFIRRLLVCR